jgi:hypothetical protein
MEEIRTEWKELRSALGNLICHIDSKTAQLNDMESAYKKGFEKGVEYGRKASKSNANKFVEVFGFMPGYEILDDGRSYYPSLETDFWEAEYKPPKEETNEL